MTRRWGCFWRVVGAIALFVFGVILGSFNGQFAGMEAAMRPSTRAEAIMVYECAVRQDYEPLLVAGVINEEVMERLIERDEAAGPVTGYEIEEITLTGSKKQILARAERGEIAANESLFGIQHVGLVNFNVRD